MVYLHASPPERLPPSPPLRVERTHSHSSRMAQNDELQAALKAVHVHACDAPREVYEATVMAAVHAFRAHSKGEAPTQHDIAALIRKECAAKMPGTWHVIVGASYGAYMTHEAGTLSYFTLGESIVLAYKHG